MKICIVSFANIFGTPYMNKYIDICRENNLSFDVIYWDRRCMGESLEGCDNLYSYKRAMSDSSNLFTKLIYMYGYKRFVEKIIRKNSYDKVVVLTSLLGVLLENFLTKNYKGRYIFDIRDHSYEHIGWYYNKMGILLNNSALNILSSEGFKNFLPKTTYKVMHNCNYSDVGTQRFKKETPAKINVAFIGTVRYKDECIKFIDNIKNNERIDFHFWGGGLDEVALKSYCSKGNIENVYFHGRYSPDQKDKICMSCDLIYNAYGDGLHLKYALSNKYYDALYFKKPLIVNKDTIMSDMSCGLSFSLDYSKDITEEIIKWYASIDEEKFNETANKYLNSAIRETKDTEKIISDTLLM